MQLGWIDFSKKDRDKVRGVLDLLGEKGVLDELGIATIRDSFSNLFFPGITTIQTRAKYFLITPYVLKDLELNNDKTIQKLANTLDETEQECAKIFLKKNPLEQGVIGTLALKQDKWVKRPPVIVYWTGLKQYKIFKDERLSISEYLKLIAFQKNRNENLKNTTTNIPEEADDKDAGHLSNFHCLNIPTYQKDWINNLQMDLTYDEAIFLKSQIIESCSNSMFAFILENNLKEVLEFNSFKDLETILYKFPEEIQYDFIKAKEFSDFIYVLRVLYNKIVSLDKNSKANNEFEKLEPILEEISEIDIDYLFLKLKVTNHTLKTFLIKTQGQMKEKDIEGLKKTIQEREYFLKGPNRAKTMHPGEFDTSIWFAGGQLDYRFSNAKAIIADIFKGCDQDA